MAKKNDSAPKKETKKAETKQMKINSDGLVEIKITKLGSKKGARKEGEKICVSPEIAAMHIKSGKAALS